MRTKRVWTIPVEPTDGQEDDAADLLRCYYTGIGSDGGPAYTGAMFERLTGGGDRPEVADRFTADDLVAVTMLSVAVPAGAALRILGSRATELAALLSAIPRDLDLADAGDDVIGTDSPRSAPLDRHKARTRTGRGDNQPPQDDIRLGPARPQVPDIEVAFAHTHGPWRERRGFRRDPRPNRGRNVPGPAPPSRRHTRPSHATGSPTRRAESVTRWTARISCSHRPKRVEPMGDRTEGAARGHRAHRRSDRQGHAAVAGSTWC